LTHPNHIRKILTLDQLKAGGIVVAGAILCNKCRKKTEGVCLCTPKGNAKCIVAVYSKGRHYEYRRDDAGFIFTYDTATAKLIDISNAIKKGTFNPLDFTDAKITERKFEHQIEAWLAEKERREAMDELSPGTLRDYRGYVKNYYGFFDGQDARDIGLEQLSNFKDTLGSVSIKTRKNIMNALRNFFNYLKDRGIVKDAPRFPVIKGDDAKMRTAIDVDVQEEVLKRLTAQHRDVFEFLMETGLRPGEVCALLVEHVDLSTGSARIERTFSGNKIRETTKQKRKRVIPLSRIAREIAQRHIQGKHPKAYLFVNPGTNRHYLPKTLWYEWNAHSGLDICLYEGTRHSFASQLIQGNDVTIVKALMGHSDIRTTEKYTHMRVSRLADVVDARKVIRLQKSDISQGEGSHSKL
jgi:integrase/recombinase XerD